MERSCGAVLYKMVNGVPYYVLVLGSVYGFPKGHMEHGETEEETALREVEEETGVKPRIDTGFRRVIEYELPQRRGRRKSVTIFAADFEGEAKPSHEIRSIAVKPYDEAVKLLKHEALRKVLSDAHEYILAKR